MTTTPQEARALAERLRDWASDPAASGTVPVFPSALLQIAHFVSEYAALLGRQAQPVACAHVWGYAVRNPREPSWPVELVRTADSAHAISRQLYAFEIIPLYAAPPAKPALTDEELRAMLPEPAANRRRQQTNGGYCVVPAYSVAEVLDAMRAVERRVRGEA